MLYSRNNWYNSLKNKLITDRVFWKLTKEKRLFTNKKRLYYEGKTVIHNYITKKKRLFTKPLVFFVNEKKTLSLQSNLNVK